MTCCGAQRSSWSIGNISHLNVWIDNTWKHSRGSRNWELCFCLCWDWRLCGKSKWRCFIAFGWILGQGTKIPYAVGKTTTTTTTNKHIFSFKEEAFPEGAGLILRPGARVRGWSPSDSEAPENGVWGGAGWRGILCKAPPALWVSFPTRNMDSCQALAQRTKGKGMLGGVSPGYNVPRAFEVTPVSLCLQASATSSAMWGRSQDLNVHFAHWDVPKCCCSGQPLDEWLGFISVQMAKNSFSL